MSTTPSGLWARPAALLATMLSTLEPFQAFAGVETASAALARVYHEGMAEPEDEETGEYTLTEIQALRPCAIIGSPEADGWDAARVAEECFVDHGRIVVCFVKSVSSNAHGLPTADDIVAFKNAVGPILGKVDDTDADGLLDLPWQYPNIAIRRIRCVEGPFWGNPEAVQNEGVWIGATFLVEW